jgi:penicillin amidase
LEPGDASLRAFRAMNRARDPAQVERALGDIGPIVQNGVFAGDDGHIGFRVAGRVPVRRADNDLFGAAPAPGWDPRYDWQRWMDTDELPHTLDPASGVVVTANQKVTPPGYTGFVTTDWQAPFRANRIEQRLDETARHSVASFESIQADATSLAADDMMVALVNAQPQTELGRAALQRLRGWDGSMKAGAPQPLVYETWMRRLKQRLFGAALGPLAADIVEPNTMIGALQGVLTGRAHARRWCAQAAAASSAGAELAATPASDRNDCMRVAGQALDEAAAEWARKPADLDQLRWGRQHRAVFEHRPFSRVELLRGWFEPNVADSGDDFTVNVGHLRLKGARPFEATSGPSMRTIFDLSSPTGGEWMFAPGQAGNLFSVHYDDLLEAWGKVRYRPAQPGKAEPLRLLLEPVSR